MSKAIYGHFATQDPALLAEVARLRRRVRELEEQVAAYDEAFLGRAIRLEDTLDSALETLSSSEPALA